MDTVAAFLIGLSAAYIGAIAAGGGLISIPGLIFLGLSPISAIATSRLNLMSGGISALYRYQKSGSILWKYIPQFFVLAVLAGIIGPKLLLSIDQDVVERLVGATFLLMLPVLWIKKDAGTINVKRSATRRYLGLPVVALILLYMTMFAGGGGIFMIYAFVYFFGMTVTEANATSFAVALIAAFVALITYTTGGAVNWHLGIPLMVGGGIGGYIGANTALKKGTAWVKVILTIIILVSGIKLLFFG